MPEADLYLWKGMANGWVNMRDIFPSFKMPLNDTRPFKTM